MSKAAVKEAVATTAVTTRKAAALTIKTPATRPAVLKEVPLKRVETRKATVLRPSN